MTGTLSKLLWGSGTDPFDAFTLPDDGTLATDTLGAELTTPPDLALAAYVIDGSKWGSPAMGTSPGVVTWSLMANGTGISAGLHDELTQFGIPQMTVNGLSTFLYGSFENDLRAAFAAWSAAANITFIEVADGGGQAGTGTMADIRVGGLSMDGAGNTLAFSLFPDAAANGASAGDVYFDVGDASFFDPHSFFLVATHEIGHAIGLDHSSDPTALMYGTYNGALSGLQSDDIAGARSIYGTAPVAGTGVAYSVPVGQTTLTIINGVSNLTINANNAGDTITGSSFAEAINGGTGNDVLNGGAGDDTLNGGVGNDTMAGGTGNDTYYVDSDTDIVSEAVGAGNDTVYTSHFYFMPANVETLIMTGTGDLWAVGNGIAHTMYGNSGNNSLTAGTGTATMYGGAGDDIYYVNKVSDVAIENPNEGFDTIFTPFSMTAPANFEAVALTAGTANLSLTGGTGNNLVFLYGNFGNNTLTSGGGQTIMVGQFGDDVAYVNHDNDQVVEAPNQGYDIIYSSISYSLSDYVEEIHLTGTGNLYAVGNAGPSALYGNSGSNSLIAGSGVATMYGGLGDDLYTVNKVTDVVIENANEGFDTVFSSVSYTLSANVEALQLTGTGAIAGTGNGMTNFLYGNSGNNTLDGAGGVDVLTGNGGADRFVLGIGGGNDIVTDFSHAQGDQVDLTAFHTTFAALGIAQSGADAVITVASQTMTLQNVTAATLTSADFLL